MSTQRKPRIVILGGGFGGVYTFRHLTKLLRARDADITIINRTNYFLFTPLLHEVATGALAHHNVVESLRVIIKGTHARLCMATVERVDTAAHIVRTSVGDIPYDYLVIALGATTQFYSIPGAAEHSLVLKDLYDAIKLRNATISACESAVIVTDPARRKKMLTFTVIGGGPTGVELAAEMADLLFETVEKFYRGVIDPAEVTIHLATAADSLLPQFHPSLRAHAKRALEAKGVRVHVQKQVTKIESERVWCGDGGVIDTGTIVWVAGVSPVSLPADHSWPMNRGRIVVNEYMQVSGHNAIFALGDIASREQSQGTSAPSALPMLAQVAVREAVTVAHNITRLIRSRSSTPPRLVAFRYRSRGELVSVGSWYAIANIGGIRLFGPIAWFLWRTVYLFKFLSWSKRIKVAFDWTIDIFYPRDITKA